MNWHTDALFHDDRLALLTGCAAKTVLYLAHLADDRGEAWPSVTTIAVSIGNSERCVNRAIAELERAGLIASRHAKGRVSVRKLILVPLTPTSPTPDAQTTPPLTPTSPLPLTPRPEGGDAQTTPPLTPTSPIPTNDPPLPTRERSRRAKQVESPGFDAFWSAYPRKTDKDAARRAFDKLSPDDTLLKTILLAIERQKGSDQWQDPRYVPHASTWLNRKRWEDELPSNGQHRNGQRSSGVRDLTDWNTFEPTEDMPI